MGASDVLMGVGLVVGGPLAGAAMFGFPDGVGNPGGTLLLNGALAVGYMVFPGIVVAALAYGLGALLDGGVTASEDHQRQAEEAASAEARAARQAQQEAAREEALRLRRAAAAEKRRQLVDRYGEAAAVALEAKLIDEDLAAHVRDGALTLDRAVDCATWPTALVEAMLAEVISEADANIAGEWKCELALEFVHGKLDLETGQTIHSGKPKQGMSEALVQRMWGRPGHRAEKVLKSKTRREWTWYRMDGRQKRVRRKATFEDGVLVGWEIR